MNAIGRPLVAYAGFLDPTKKPVVVVDFVVRQPGEARRVRFEGAGVVIADAIPLRIGDENRSNLPGRPLGDAVMQALSPDALQKWMQKAGCELADQEVADLMSPFLALASSGSVILAGSASPPGPDPKYVAFSPVSLGLWRFIPGADKALPLVPGAAEYILLRAFSPIEWAAVAAHDFRLRPSSIQSDQMTQQPVPFRSGVAGRPTSKPLTEMEMRARAARGEMLPSLSAEAAYLSRWLSEKHPDKPPAGPSALRDGLRDLYWSLRKP
jgi:hypothetical protein